MSEYRSAEIPPPSPNGFLRVTAIIFLLLVAASLGIAAIWSPQTLYAHLEHAGGMKEVSAVTTAGELSRWDIRMLAYQTGRYYGVEPELVTSVIAVESNYKVDARSRAGALGLMQLMPATAKILNISDPLNATQNVDGGTRYLKHLLERYKGDKRLALAAYNAGPRAVKRYRGVPPFRETRRYVKRVLALYAKEKERRGISVREVNEEDEAAHSRQLHGLR